MYFLVRSGRGIPPSERTIACGIINCMGISEIENAIKNLPPDKVNELMDWFLNYHAEIWEAKIESDLENGRLDSVLEDVNTEISSGLSKPV